MKDHILFGDVRLLLRNEILAVISEREMTSASSAVHNGGLRKAKAVLNVHVPESYDQKLLHEHPEQIISEAAEKLGLNPQLSVGMITAADVTKFSTETTNRDGMAVASIVTAGCSLAETAGENIEAGLTAPGTINIIVVIDGNPTESCLLQTFITATEAKTAGLRDLDIRSIYTGDLATGTITDSLTIVSTNSGPKVRYGGPASKLGKMVGYCTREAVKNAVLKSGNISLTRSLWKRLSERKIPLEELLSEISRTCRENVSREEIASKVLKEPLFALMLMMAAEIDEEIKRGLIPEELSNINALSEEIAKRLFKNTCREEKPYSTANGVSKNSYPFLRGILTHIIGEISNTSQV